MEFENYKYNGIYKWLTLLEKFRNPDCSKEVNQILNSRLTAVHNQIDHRKNYKLYALKRSG